jgi:hypothetical protein
VTSCRATWIQSLKFRANEEIDGLTGTSTHGHRPRRRGDQIRRRRLPSARRVDPAGPCAFAAGWAGLGATHLCINAMQFGLADVDAHLEAWRRTSELVVED